MLKDDVTCLAHFPKRRLQPPRRADLPKLQHKRKENNSGINSLAMASAPLPQAAQLGYKPNVFSFWILYLQLAIIGLQVIFLITSDALTNLRNDGNDKPRTKRRTTTAGDEV